MSRKKVKLDMSLVSKNVDFVKAFNEKEVLNGIVMRTQMTDAGNVLIVQIDDKNIIIPKKQVGHLPNRKKLGDLVGTNLHVVITSINGDEYYGSHAEACEIMAQPALDKLKNGEAIDVIVRRIVNYGVFVSISIGINALIRNSDALTGSGCAGEHLQLGQMVKARLKSIDENSGKIYLELVNKIETPNIVPTGLENIDVSKGQVFMGRVKTATPQIVIVDLGGGLTGTAKPNLSMKLVENVNVRYRVVNVSKKGIIGQILTVL